MARYRVSYRQTEYRSAIVKADSPEEAQERLEQFSADVTDDWFDMAEETEVLNVEEI